MAGPEPGFGARIGVPAVAPAVLATGVAATLLLNDIFGVPDPRGVPRCELGCGVRGTALTDLAAFPLEACVDFESAAAGRFGFGAASAWAAGRLEVGRLVIGFDRLDEKAYY